MILIIVIVALAISPSNKFSMSLFFIEKLDKMHLAITVENPVYINITCIQWYKYKKNETFLFVHLIIIDKCLCHNIVSNYFTIPIYYFRISGTFSRIWWSASNWRAPSNALATVAGRLYLSTTPTPSWSALNIHQLRLLMTMMIALVLTEVPKSIKLHEWPPTLFEAWHIRS